MTVSSEQALRRANRSLLAVLALFGTALSMSFFDRPLALWAHRTFVGTRTFAAADFLLAKLDPIAVLGCVLLIAGAAGWIVNRRMPAWVKRYVVAATSAAAAIVVTELFKWAIGRSSPYPLFIENHIYAFRPFSGKPDYMDFPSGTLTVAVGFMTGWRPAAGVQRAVAGVVAVALALSLLVTNGHWTSDMMAGGLVGWSVGLLIPHAFARFQRAVSEPT